MISLPPISDPNTRSAFNVVLKELNVLQEAVNSKQQSLGFTYKGKEGDTQIVESKDKDKLFLINAKGLWYSTFTGCFQPYKAGDTPNLHLKNLEVDNLYAKLFTVRQTQAWNGDALMTDTAIVESVSGNTITFKDQSNLNLCPFVQYDKCETEQIAIDKSLTIRLVQFTVDSVSGRTVTVTYEGGSAIARTGDVVVRKGNSSVTARKNTILFKTNVSTTPYIDLYTGTTGFTFGTPKVSIGDLTHITDADFGGALVGDGAYLTNAYIKGKVILSNQSSITLSGFNNDAGFITSADGGNKTFYNSTAPTVAGNGLKVGDFWFDSTSGVMRMKRCSAITPSVTWDVVSVYMDANGLYVGSLNAGQITAGEITSIIYKTAAVNNARMETAANGLYFYKADNSSGGSLTHISSSGDVYLAGENSLSLSAGGYIKIQLTASTCDLAANATINSSQIASQAWVYSKGYISGIDWTEITNKPSTFAPSSHSNTAHSATYITSSAFSDLTNGNNLINTVSSNATWTTAVMGTWKNWANTQVIQYKDWAGNNQSATLVNNT
jgi:hypothetical protein